MRSGKGTLPTDAGYGTALGYLHQPWLEETSLLGLLILPMNTLAAFDLNLVTLSIMLP